jgi:hypothetical protein
MGCQNLLNGALKLRRKYVKWDRFDSCKWSQCSLIKDTTRPADSSPSMEFDAACTAEIQIS